ncbi:MAG: integrase, partial [Pseudonocardia sp.]|nr:integrase [Pseudonocardia sp.]
TQRAPPLCQDSDGRPNARCRWCDRACGPHICEPLSAGSIRVIHAILSGAFMRAPRPGGPRLERALYGSADGQHRLRMLGDPPCS